jgi:5'-phosphate synthase pdxT subunit
LKVGILAIQGDFNLQKEALNKLHIESVYVKTSKDLMNCNAMIIPGGESTTISLLIDKLKLRKSILDFSKDHSLFGICAGSILMSSSSTDNKVNNLSIINLDTRRNSWGSQINSFSDYIDLKGDLLSSKLFLGAFIRAPKFRNISSENSILGYFNKEAVLIRNKKHLVSSFHPEIGEDLRIFEYFIEMINEQ